MVKLTGRSKRGRERIKAHGSEWVVHCSWHRVQFSSDTGPWLLVGSLLTRDTRWVHQDRDPNFKVEKILCE